MRVYERDSQVALKWSSSGKNLAVRSTAVLALLLMCPAVRRVLQASARHELSAGTGA
jgi:hypothetical protein